MNWKIPIPIPIIYQSQYRKTMASTFSWPEVRRLRAVEIKPLGVIITCLHTNCNPYWFPHSLWLQRIYDISMLSGSTRQGSTVCASTVTFSAGRGKAIMHTIATRHCLAAQHSCGLTPGDEVSRVSLQPGRHWRSLEEFLSDAHKTPGKVALSKYLSKMCLFLVLLPWIGAKN